MSSESANRYMLRGVSSDKTDVHNAIKNIDKGLFPMAFCKIVPDTLTNDPDYCLVMHADGAGTKSSLAYLYWKETGDLSVWKGIAQDALVMNLDDLLCVGVTDNILLSSTIGRNKNVITGDVIKTIIEGTEELIKEMADYGVNITSTGGETADVGDIVRTIIVDSTVLARIKKSDVIDNSNIKAGDLIVGLSSYGKANYEDNYNGGMGSNGGNTPCGGTPAPSKTGVVNSGGGGGMYYPGDLGNGGSGVVLVKIPSAAYPYVSICGSNSLVPTPSGGVAHFVASGTLTVD